MSGFAVRALAATDWADLRAARVAALVDSPDSFGGDPDAEAAWPRERWITSLHEASWAVIDGADGALGLVGVRAAQDVDDCDCWISSWWVAPQVRGSGATESLLDWVDALSHREGWHRQGLGVWVENTAARKAFARLGFEQDGADRPSRHFPGRRYVRMLRALPGSGASGL